MSFRSTGLMICSITALDCLWVSRLMLVDSTRFHGIGLLSTYLM